MHGLKKAEYHMRTKETKSLSEALVNHGECVKPRLTIMGAVVGMDGDGPSGGRRRDIGAVLASSDVHALDAIALRLVGAEPDSVWTVRVAIDRELLVKDFAMEIDIKGEALDELRVHDFKMPPKLRVFGGIPGVLGGFVAEGIARKPVFSKELCVGCGKCVDICPAEVLSLRKDELPKVGISRDGYIRCYCCHEIYPENAIALKRMPLRSWGRSVGGRLRGGLPAQRRVRSIRKE